MFQKKKKNNGQKIPFKFETTRDPNVSLIQTKSCYSHANYTKFKQTNNKIKPFNTQTWSVAQAPY